METNRKDRKMRSARNNSAGSFNSKTRRVSLGFSLVELLVVISIIALLMAILAPALSVAKQTATAAVCLSNQRSLLTGWMLYCEEHDGRLIGNLACYDSAVDRTAWVFRPKTSAGEDLASHPAPATITEEDRYRGIRAGTLWEYVKNVGVYHCPGDNRRSTKPPPRDCFRSYSISYAFGHRGGHSSRSGYRYITRREQIRNAPQYYVFVEEEGSGAAYGENDGGWCLPVGQVSLPTGVAEVRLSDPNSWMFYDSLASFHNNSSTFGFADGHSERHTWADERTLEFIRMAGEDTYPFAGIRAPSPGNKDLEWLIEHYIQGERIY